jgi:hypothetical protein
LAAEYSRWFVSIESDVPAIIPNTKSSSERGYLMASYRVADWFAPGAYYSVLFNDVDDRRARGTYQHDVAFTLRYDINQHWLVKLEGHYMRGSALLDPALNDGTPRDELTQDWGVFLVKTTAHF